MNSPFTRKPIWRQWQLINYAASKYYAGMGTPHISSNLYDVMYSIIISEFMENQKFKRPTMENKNRSIMKNTHKEVNNTYAVESNIHTGVNSIHIEVNSIHAQRYNPQ